MIAMALSCNPEILIADEPTTALDVTIQAQIVKLMKELQTNSGTSIILITHDMGIVAEMADEIMVMYAGNVVEKAEKRELLKIPCILTHEDCLLPFPLCRKVLIVYIQLKVLFRA